MKKCLLISVMSLVLAITWAGTALAQTQKEITFSGTAYTMIKRQVNHEKKNCDMDDLLCGSHRLDWLGFFPDCNAGDDEDRQTGKR
jgi:hypothetical protein